MRTFTRSRNAKETAAFRGGLPPGHEWLHVTDSELGKGRTQRREGRCCLPPTAEDMKKEPPHLQTLLLAIQTNLATQLGVVTHLTSGLCQGPQEARQPIQFLNASHVANISLDD